MMGDIFVHGAPGLPNGALDSSIGGAYFDAKFPPRKERLKRPFDTFAGADESLEFQTSVTGNALFKPDLHIVYQPPHKVYTMEDLGLPANNGVSPVAVSEPFPLFSEDAVDKMRGEVLCDVVMDDYSYTSDIAPKQLRGYAPK
jgi:hypothetical protein